MAAAVVVVSRAIRRMDLARKFEQLVRYSYQLRSIVVAFCVMSWASIDDLGRGYFPSLDTEGR